jgi:serine/threonine protein phosphatase PrpC
MGCQNSKTMETQQRDQEQMDFMAQQGANNIPGEGNNDQQYEDEYNEDGPPPLTAEEIKSRIIAGNGSMFLPDFTYSLKYAWQSQRGYYPESPNKANQDACLIVKNFGKNQNIGYFGVYDGHGAFGDKCSGFVRSKISTLMLQSIAKTPVNDPSFDRKFGAAHEKCNEMMHQASSFDDSSSGTTAVSVWIEGTTIKVANLGDSRAIVAARQSNGKLKAIALSQDQTPYRQDERERCKKTGCRVLTMDQLEGYAPTGPEYENWGVNLGEEIDDGGDPPRIWHPTKPFPGTAFTRSIGDHVAEALGVFATPEILSFDLDSSHEFIVVASDGVWEFLTSQSVVDMVASYKDPSEACRVVVHESYTLWLRHEVRTDDITMIVIQIKGKLFYSPF